MQAKTRNLKTAFKVTIIYIIFSVIYFVLGENIGGFAKDIFKLESFNSASLYIMNISLGAIVIFFAAYIISSRFGKYQRNIEECSKKLDIKTEDLGKLDMVLRDYRKFIEDILESSDVLVIVLDKNLDILEASYNIKAHTSYREDEIKGKNISILLNKAHIEEIKENITGKDEYILEMELDTKCGKKKHMRGDIRRIQDRQDENIEYTIFLSDISKRKILEEKVSYLGSYDPITSLPNRMFLEEKFKYILEEADKKGSIIAFLYIDIDDFAYINETLGHHAGDSLLRDMALLLGNSIEDRDILSRIIQD